MRHALLAATFLAGVCSATSTYALSLEDELAHMLVSNPTVLGNKHTITASDEIEKIAESEFLPTVSLYGDSGLESIENPSRRSSGLDRSNLRRDKLTLSVRHNLFDGFADENVLKSSESFSESNKARVKDVIRRELIRGIVAYIDVLRYTKIVELSRKREDTLKEQLELEDERVERGSGIEVDVLESKSRLREAKEETVARIGQYEQAVASYERAFGHLPSVVEMEPVSMPSISVPETLEESIDLGLSMRGSIQELQHDVKRFDYDIEAARAGYYPTIDLVGSVDYEDNTSATRGITKTGSIILQMNWELFSGFETRARVASSLAAASGVQDTLRSEKRFVIEDVKEAWSLYRRSAERLELLKSEVDIASELFELRKKLLDAGKETIINVLDAEDHLFDSKIAMLNMEYRVLGAAYRMLSAMGMLTPENLGIEES